MTTARTQMILAIEAANREALAELIAQTGLTPLVSPDGTEFDHTGPVLLAQTVTVGPIRIRALAVDQHGRRYADLALVAESLHPRDRDAQQVLTEMLTDQAHEVAIATLARGEHYAYLADIDTIAQVCGLPDLIELPADFGGWGRSWATLPYLTDRDAETLDDGGVPVA